MVRWSESRVGCGLILALVVLSSYLLFINVDGLRWKVVYSFSKSDRAFCRNVLEVTWRRLVEYESSHHTLPALSDEAFQEAIVPPISGAVDDSILVINYSNDPAITLDLQQKEIVVVVFKLTRPDGRSLHMLTSHSRIIQSINFDSKLWDERIVGNPVPYDLIRECVLTNLGSHER